MSWFLIVVWFGPLGTAYLQADMLPKPVASQEICIDAGNLLTALHTDLQTADPTMHDAEILCWEAEGRSQIIKRLQEQYTFQREQSS